MKSLRKRLTYANVMSTVAVFFAIGGATALAAGQLAKNSVGPQSAPGLGAQVTFASANQVAA